MVHTRYRSLIGYTDARYLYFIALKYGYSATTIRSGISEIVMASPLTGLVPLICFLVVLEHNINETTHTDFTRGNRRLVRLNARVLIPGLLTVVT